MTLDQLCSEIDRAAQLYYTPGCVSPLSDAEFDARLALLKELDPTNYRLTRVGPPYNSDNLRAKAEHSIAMGSLDNTENGIEGFDKWYTAFLGSFLVPTADIVASYKMDGASVALEYVDGVLVKAISRGNGLVGQDLTANAVKWQGVPTMLQRPVTITVRGECMLYKAEFEELPETKRRRRDGEDPGNPRNTGNGILGRLDGTDNDKLRFVAFNMIDRQNDPSKYSERLNILSELGFNVVEHWVLGGPANLIVTQTQQLMASLADGKRSELPFEIDGIVVAIDSIELQRKATTDKQDEFRPPFARAVKFETQRSTAKVIDVTLSVGHTGVIKPTIVIEPTQVGGVVITNILLNNWNENSELPSAAHVAIGDIIEVARSGDVIPKCTSLVMESVDRVPIAEPAACPACGAKTTRNYRGKVGVETYCSEASNCPEARKGRIKHFIGNSKKGVGILGVGDGVLDALTGGEAPPVKTPADLYRLTLDQLRDLPIGKSRSGAPIKLGVRRATDLLNEIDKAKILPLSKFLGSLGIDLLGRRRAVILSQQLGLSKLDDWLNQDNLSKIPGDTIREAITGGIAEYRPLIDELLAVGVEVVPDNVPSLSLVEPTDIVGKEDRQERSKDSVRGWSFCVTGTRECVDEIEAQGGTMKSGVSKGLDYLIQKDPASVSNKTQKAEQYGTKIISLDYIKKVLGGEAQLP